MLHCELVGAGWQCRLLLLLLGRRNRTDNLLLLVLKHHLLDEHALLMVGMLWVVRAKTSGCGVDIGVHMISDGLLLGGLRRRRRNHHLETGRRGL